ncbi:MAG: hiss: histidine--trna ligase [Verrucomicrobiales bacterium]|nr:hiss: histidine--trna ligase [Verrucomicrobiales bacterium]
MSASSIQSLPGFREFLPETCALRNYLFETWRAAARRYAFVEYEGPVLEPTELYRRKSGDEIVKQLFHFTDAGGREVAMRPETTPSLARMAAAAHKGRRKPMKWFQIGPCFRYERQQKGRGREFYQFNCDILGEPSVAADADLIALSIDVMRGLGFREGDFLVRLSDRNVWPDFLAKAGVAAENLPAFLQIIDKMEREKPALTAERLEALGTNREAVDAFIGEQGADWPPLQALLADLTARGLSGFVSVDLGIVRGLAYYTGAVFEIFDIRKGMRAVAGGGRYDNLCQLIGGNDLPACGFAMGDMVIGDFLNETPHAKARYETWLAGYNKIGAFVVIADETRRPDALATVQALRSAGIATDYNYLPAKVDKQFQTAEALGAKIAVIIGAEFPEVRLKDLARRTEQAIPFTGLSEAAAAVLAQV